MDADGRTRVEFLVSRDSSTPPIGSGTRFLLFGAERFPSGQREQTVNLPAYAFGGSNPPLSTSDRGCRYLGGGNSSVAGIAQLVEREPSKLGVAGSSPVSRSNLRMTVMADSRWAGVSVLKNSVPC